MQQIELVAVQRLLHRIDSHIHVVSGKMLGNLVARPDSTTVTLLQVGRSPRCIKMMNSHTPFLRVHTRSEHTRGTEQHTHRSGVHGVYHRLASLVRLALLNKAHLACRNAVVLHQLPLYLAVHVPSVSRLVGTQIREDELRSLVRIVFVVILCYHLGAVARLVVRMVFVIGVYHAHIQSHLSCIVSSDEHLRLFLRFRQWQSAQ